MLLSRFRLYVREREYMAGIKTTLSIVDRMTAPIMSINNAINYMQKSFTGVKTAADITPQSLTVMKNQVDMANAAAELLNQNFTTVKNSVENTSDSQRKFNETIQQAHMPIDGLIRKIGAAVTAYASIQGAKKFLGLSDEIVNTTARLNLMNDGLQTTQELQNKIYASAQRTGSAYLDVSNSISKMGIMAGKAFSSNDELIAFTELMNKNFAIGGASIQEQTSAMYQLTQAMASGRLQGDEYRSIIENAPLLAKSIESYMQGAGMQGTMKDWAKEGLLTAEVIKAAVFSSTDEIQERFENIPTTWGMIFENVKSTALMAFQPVLNKINEIANNPQAQDFVANLGQAFVYLANFAVNSMDAVGRAIEWAKQPLSVVSGWVRNIWEYISNNWSKIAPIINVVAGALAALVGVFLLYKAAVTIAAIAQGIFNMALFASPLTWVIIIIIAIIAALYFVINTINKVAGTSVSATGIIFGAFAVLGAFLWDLFLGLLELVLGVINYMINPFINIANFIGNVFQNPVSSIIYLFQGMADNVLALLQKVASAIDFVFGSSMADAVQGWRNNLKGMADAAVAKYAPNENYEKVVDNLNLSVEGLGLKRWAYGDAWDAGYAAGENLEAGINDFDPNSLFSGQSEIPEIFGQNYDYASLMSGVGNIDANTKSTADYSEEELKLWRDIAERDTINRFTTAEVTVDFGGITQNVNSDMDLDGIVNYIAEGVGEALLVTAEGANA